MQHFAMTKNNLLMLFKKMPYAYTEYLQVTLNTKRTVNDRYSIAACIKIPRGFKGLEHNTHRTLIA